MTNLPSHIKHIAIAGNIGAGKTTLAAKLSKHFDWGVHFEDADNNPYLEDFYNDMVRWSFNLQIYFLQSRFQQIIKIRTGTQTVIQDRSIYEDANIFAPNLHDMGLMSKRDFDNYLTLFNTMVSQIKPPDLMIYLKAGIPTLVNHIQTRGREYEGNMSLDYLKRLNNRYDKWMSDYKEGPLLVINSDDIDFINRPEDLGVIIQKVQAEIHGLF